MDAIKGAFKDFPPEKQPVRIPLAIIPKLETNLTVKFGLLGDLHFPATLKKSKKKTTGDIDVLFVPRIKTWKCDILNSPHVVAYISNSAQLMTVMENIAEDGQRYMIDFLVVKKGGLAFKKLFYGYGTTFSAMLGSFARSIGYKFTDYALYKRTKDSRNQWHNVKLTSDPEKALLMLGLDPTFVDDDEIFSAEGVASWITNSPRFDSYMWKNGNPNKIAVGIPINKNARDAIKKNDETENAYELINLVEQRGYAYGYMEYERKLLGDKKVDAMIKKIEEVIVNTKIILNGNEIIELLNIKPGPMIGKMQKYLAKQFAEVPDSEKQSFMIKERAKDLLKTLHSWEKQNAAV